MGRRIEAVIAALGRSSSSPLLPQWAALGPRRCFWVLGRAVSALIPLVSSRWIHRETFTVRPPTAETLDAPLMDAASSLNWLHRRPQADPGRKKFFTISEPR